MSEPAHLSRDPGDADEVPTGARPPGPARGPSARAYLLMVLGEYALDHDGAVWTQTVVDALALVGFEEKATRQALTRSAATGLLSPVRVGRRTCWQLTGAGREALLAARARLFATGPETEIERDRDGDWLILLTSVPESNRNLRHRLRSSLSWAGFGSLGPGVWLSPHPSRAGEVRQVLDSLGQPVHGTLLHARLDDPGERLRLVNQAWDISVLDRRYSAFIERFGHARPESPGAALAQLAQLVYEWRRLLLADPGLPANLLPAGWSGEQARQLLLDQHGRWLPRAEAWWRASVQDNGGLPAHPPDGRPV